MKTILLATALAGLMPLALRALETVPGQGGMLDFNVTLVIQAVNYLVFIAIMDRVFFRPMLAHLDARRSLVTGADAAAREAQREAEAVDAERRAKLAAVYRAEHEERAKARAHALGEYQHVVAAARAEGDHELQVARESARLEAARLERELESSVPELGSLMAEAVIRTRADGSGGGRA